MYWSSGDVVQFTYAYIVYDHPAMGMDAGPVRAYRKERDAVQSMNGDNGDDGVVRKPCAIDEHRKEAYVIWQDGWFAVSFHESF